MAVVCGSEDGRHQGLVLFSVFMSYVLSHGVTWSLGVFYVIFLDELTYSSISQVALGTALNHSLFCGIGPLAGVLINMYGPRKVALAGGLLSGGSLIATIFSRQVFYMCSMFGVVCGMGLGMCLLAHTTAIYVHFGRWGPLALAIASTGCGIGTLLYPFVVERLVRWYGWRGALLLLGGVTLNLLPCALPYGDRATESNPKGDTQETPVRQAWNLQIFYNRYYILFCLSNFFAIVGLSIVYVHLAAYAITLGVPSDKAAYLFSTMGGFNIIGRLLLGGLTQIPACTGIRVYVVGMGLAGIATLCIPSASCYSELQVYSGIFGLMMGCWGSPVSKCVIEIVGVTKMPSGYGYLLMFEMVGQVIGAPVVGLLYERTGVYFASFYMAGSVLAVAAIIMVLPALCPPPTTDSVDDTAAVAKSIEALQSTREESAGVTQV